MWRKNEVNNLIIRIDGALGKKTNMGQQQLGNSIQKMLLFPMLWLTVLNIWIYELWNYKYMKSEQLNLNNFPEVSTILLKKSLFLAIYGQ